MNEFDRQNEDVFSLVRENRRRSDLAPVIGHIVPQQEVQELAVKKATGNRADGIGALVLLAAQLFVLVTVAVVALA